VVLSTYVDRADEVLVLRQNRSHSKAENDGEEPGTKETFPRLLGRDLDQGCPAKSDAAQVCEDVVSNNHGHGQEKPDEAFKNVVDDKVSLPNDEEESHVSPGELTELKLVMTLLQG
jgi:hypothetical protein